MKLLAVLAIASLGLAFAAILYLACFLAWWAHNAQELRYFGRPIAERRAFRSRVATYGCLVRPIFNAGLGKLFNPEWLELRQAGLRFPKSACTPQSVTAALAYRPVRGDVFIATQMKCGTTWMQQIAYEILSHGQGDLGDRGHIHLNAMSPWLEAGRGVSMNDAPLIGKARARIIKTHLPASHCPYSADAKYIYVTRHPVSCYLSCMEFVDTNGGPMMRQGEDALDWFCSDAMWWGSWPDHVSGWWEWAATRRNVLFLHFETLKHDLPAAIREIARFLDVALTEEEIALVARKSSFEYMKEREEWFEMSVPTVFGAGQTLFKSGSATRQAGTDPNTRERILNFCRERLAGTSYAAMGFYPELTESPGRVTELPARPRPGGVPAEPARKGAAARFA